MNKRFNQFNAEYAADDIVVAKQLWAETDFGEAFSQRVFARGEVLVSAMRNGANRFGDLEDFLREYGLSTKEGLALMCLAEALLRVPDTLTIDKLIEDKLGRQNWHDAEDGNSSALVSVSTWALALGSKIVAPEDTPHAIMNGVVKRVGMPSVRIATKQAMKFMGHHFVLGQSIKDAIKRAKIEEKKGYCYSYDMLGEGARTQNDASRYFASYKNAIEAIGKKSGKDLHENAGISIKLSALHPRYDARQAERVIVELVPQVIELAKLAKSYNLNFTIDAEEANRLELSLFIIGEVFSDHALRGWDGFGLAIQAYSKRANAVIDWVHALCVQYDAKMMVRLVKGAYWDAEIKHAHLEGAHDFPVYTRKPLTDIAYLAAAKRMMSYHRHIFSQFATHNAGTVANIIELAYDMNIMGQGKFEFQRLHGMGDALYEQVTEKGEKIPCRIYAPVGGHKDLLAYLVRRLLENGANSSFVHAAGDNNYPIAKLLQEPKQIIGSPLHARHKGIIMPADIYGIERKNPAGVEFGHRGECEAFIDALNVAFKHLETMLADKNSTNDNDLMDIYNPSNGNVMGRIKFNQIADIDMAVKLGNEAFFNWSNLAVEKRAALLEKTAEILIAKRDKAIALLCVEAGKTLDDGIAEWREAVDFCLYYANQARNGMVAGHVNLGPTGEENIYSQMGRGTFICISPWNFPLAIFLGQVVAALVTGNSVIAKPAETTPLIAKFAIDILHEAGIGKHVVQLMVGAGDIGAALVAHKAIAGVVFTGSTATAKHINIELATKENAPIIPLIAETGGMNAMIVDATALPEQVTDDVIDSAFHSAGQRCSALRVLYIQEDIADKVIEMIIGAAKELKLGDPKFLETDIGPVIDQRAKDGLDAHIVELMATKKCLYAGEVPLGNGTYVAPHIFEIDKMDDLKGEVFGPVLHIIRFKGAEINEVVAEINQTGFGLTLGIHSRLDTQVQHIIDHARVGNIYVNRNMIGAVVGVQPFGGMGLSGTGPKAGGRNYLIRFMGEQVVSYNTAAAGGNATLIASSGEG